MGNALCFLGPGILGLVSLYTENQSKRRFHTYQSWIGMCLLLLTLVNDIFYFMIQALNLKVFIFFVCIVMLRLCVSGYLERKLDGFGDLATFGFTVCGCADRESLQNAPNDSGPNRFTDVCGYILTITGEFNIFYFKNNVLFSNWACSGCPYCHSCHWMALRLWRISGVSIALSLAQSAL